MEFVVLLLPRAIWIFFRDFLERFITASRTTASRTSKCFQYIYCLAPPEAIEGRLPVALIPPLKRSLMAAPPFLVHNHPEDFRQELNYY